MIIVIIDRLGKGVTVRRLVRFNLIGCHHIISRSASLTLPLKYKGNWLLPLSL
jgi:hypothetical protein